MKILLILALLLVGCGPKPCGDLKFKIGDKVRVKGLASVYVVTDSGYCAVGIGGGVKDNTYGLTGQDGKKSSQWEQVLEKAE